MPAPIDLSGQRYGKLTVIAEAGRAQRLTNRRAWICLCDCGNEEIVPQDRLPYRDWVTIKRAVTACSECRKRVCVICGEAFYPKTCSLTCSGNCKISLELQRDEREEQRVAVGGEYHEQQLENQRRHYAGNIEQNREYRRLAHIKYRRKIALAKLLKISDELTKRR
jgi:CxxC motif-containing protein